MKHKFTPLDLALWAALPMAHTSKMEGRIAMILDKSRKRALSRRALVLGVALTAAALVPLAMLRPVAKAQTVPAVAGAVQLLGVQDINIHHTDHCWWKPSGQILPNAVYDTGISEEVKDLFSSSNVKNLRFALRLPATTQDDLVTFIPAGSPAFFPQEASWQAKPGGQIPQAGVRSGKSGTGWTLNAVFPSSAKTTAIDVGIAAGRWTEAAAHAPTRTAASTVTNPNGTFRFGPVLSPAGQGPKRLWSVTITMNKSSQAWRVVGVDQQGHLVRPLSSTGPSEMQRTTVTSYFTSPNPLSQIKELRLEHCPYQWTEFKDVALQPTAGQTVSASGPEAATERLHRL